eukprot:4694423-Pleurochrysis_carterae.AAC.1
MQAQYAESIQYINPMSGTEATSSMLNFACPAEQEVPILAARIGGAVHSSTKRSFAERGAGVGERLPFWLAIIAADEEAPIDTFGARIRPADPEDKFTMHWLSVFNTQGRLASSVVGSWVPRCKRPDARGRVHAWNEVHRNARTIYQC